MQAAKSYGDYLLVALVLIAALFVSATAQRVCQADSSQTVDREGLRYARKSFAWWSDELRAELKAELRVEAIKAMSAFGSNGYAEEAAAAIIDVVKDYDVATNDRAERSVTSAADRALKKIGRGAAPAVVSALNGSDKQARLYAARVLARYRLDESVVPALVAAIGDEDLQVRRSAILGLSKNVGQASTEEAVGVLIRVMNAGDLETRCVAAQALGQMAPNGPTTTKALISAMTDKQWILRQNAVEALRAMRPNRAVVDTADVETLEQQDRNLVVPALIVALDDEQPTVRQVALDLMIRIGPPASAAVPALIEAFYDVDDHERLLVARALGNIGPEAIEALPVMKMAKQAKDSRLQKVAEEAVLKISK
jgi:HEAT repeat protein